mmetsp:Transcript_9979/g.23348  ORF Transcript_9979/g.23348 Transcript_9979/m.23348 type:complete len:131 (+) Transcript_9979:298-690(+)
MIWIKPLFGSFACWILKKRCGSGRKAKQENVLKVELSRDTTASILDGCCTSGHGKGGATGRVQWDPAQDLWSSSKNGKQSKRTTEERAIHIGMLKTDLYNVDNVVFMESVAEVVFVPSHAEINGRTSHRI